MRHAAGGFNQFSLLGSENGELGGFFFVQRKFFFFFPVGDSMNDVILRK